MRLSGKVTLVTGASHGIGAAIADVFAMEGTRGRPVPPTPTRIRALVGPSIASVAFRDAERDQQALLQDLLEPGDGRIMLVAERDGVTCGFCAVTWKAGTGVGEIGLNAVHPTAQGSGVGQRPYVRRAKVSYTSMFADHHRQ